MKKGILISGIILTFVAAGFGQKNKTPDTTEQNTSARPQTAKTNSRTINSSGSGNATGNAAANVGNSSLNAGTALSAALQNTVDVRRSKVGDKVVLKTVRDIKENGKTVVPKGTQLVGRITEITQRSKNNAESRIGMVFDRLQGSNLSEPISASIVSITNVATTVSAGDDLFADMSGSSSTSARASRGSTSSGGGLLGGTGGLLGGATSTVGSTAGSVLNTTTSTVGGVTDTATRTVGSTTSGVGNTVNGLRISGSASGSANNSTTISSGDKNLNIQKGATFNLVVNN